MSDAIARNQREVTEKNKNNNHLNNQLEYFNNCLKYYKYFNFLFITSQNKPTTIK